jgi:protein gp37
MAEWSKIEWTDHTWNPWVGCEKISPACDLCYAEGWAKRAGRAELWNGTRSQTSPTNWAKPLKWDAAAKAEGVRRRVFCASLADFFDNQAEPHWRGEAWATIRLCPNLDWLLLTKRPQNIRKMLPPDWGSGWPHVWLGTTVESQKYYDQRWKHLRQVPAVVRFISYEPALGPIPYLWNEPGIPTRPDWIICGGESGGKKARMMDAGWAREMRDDCAASGVAFFMKQMTNKAPIPSDLMVRQFPTRPPGQ